MSLRFLSALTLLASLAAAQDYFPLQVGNQWVYRTTGTAPERKLSLEITASREFNGNTYYRLTGLATGAYWLRHNDEGAMVAYDEQQQRDRIWYVFPAPAGSTYETEVPSCCGRATIVSRSARYDGALGQLNNALELTYPGVFQVGMVREQFLPSIGLAYREENVGGPGVLRHELAYARLRGSNVFTASEVSFRLSLDRISYSPSASLNARLTLASTNGQAVRITFPSSQRFDLAIRNSTGETVYHWSADKLFLQIFGTEEFRGESHWLVSVPLNNLQPGRYAIEAWIASQGSPLWKATSNFEVDRPQ